MALYIPHSIFHLARLLYVRPETFGPYCVWFKSSWVKGLSAGVYSILTGPRLRITPLEFALRHREVVPSLIPCNKK